MQNRRSSTAFTLASVLPRKRKVHGIPAAAGLVLVLVVVVALEGCHHSAKAPRAAFAPGPPLSEESRVANDLQRSLSAFLLPLRRGELSPAHTDPDERQRYAFFYESLLRGARDAEPVVLKSYPIDEGSFLITVAFLTGAADALRISRIVELEARPIEGGFRFRCPYEYRTAQLRRHAIGDVTFRFRGPFDKERATDFTRFKAEFERHLGREPSPLVYDCFQSLDELLHAFGLVHDASKCNFLRHDLGFLWDDGRRFATGTAKENYIFGYVRAALSTGAATPAETYRPYVNGIAAYYGGYGLSGDSMEVLARQFRDEVERRPTIDFLEEFQKGRKSSVQRHFSFYVMCAFLYEELVARHGESTALQLVHSGAHGERFFSDLERLIGVTEENFHATILRLISAEGREA